MSSVHGLDFSIGTVTVLSTLLYKNLRSQNIRRMNQKNDERDAALKHFPRRLQLLATASSAFALPLMVRLSGVEYGHPMREFLLICLATLCGAAIGFVFFLPVGTFSGSGSLVRKVFAGATLGIVISILLFERLGLPPLAPITLCMLVMAASLGGIAAWCYSLSLDLLACRQGHRSMAWPLRLLFDSGYVSVGAWVAIFLASGIGYVLQEMAFSGGSARQLSRRSSATTKSKLLSIDSLEDINLRLGDRHIGALAKRSGTRSGAKRSETLPVGLEPVLPSSSAARTASSPSFDPHHISSLVAAEPKTIPADHRTASNQQTDSETPIRDTESTQRIADVAELLSVIKNSPQESRRQAILALDEIDPLSADAAAWRKPIAKAYKSIAFNSEDPECQPAGVRGMVRWGGKFSAKYLLKLRDSNPTVPVAEAIDEALADLAELDVDPGPS